MKYKYLLGLVGLALTINLLATPILADTNTTGVWDGDGKGETDVTVLVSPTYVVTIPATFNFSATGEQGTAGNIAISGSSQLETDGILRVKLMNTNSLQATKLFNNGASTSVVPFTVAYGGVSSKTNYVSYTETIILQKTGDDIATNNGLSTGVYLTVGSFAAATAAGTHRGTLNFSVSYTPGNS